MKNKIAFLSIIFSLFYFFCYAETITGKYFTVSYESSCNLMQFNKKIDSDNFFGFDSILSDTSNINSIIAQNLDNLYSEVSDILDIHMYSYHGNIKVLPNRQEVNKVILSSSVITGDLPSIYVPADNTIYISLQDLTLGMLSHEIAHAIISNYFVVAPPEKVQEILAGYVEYSIRKKSGNLPQKR